MSQQNWMAALAAHDAKLRRDHPEDRLVVVFDIDGTILDTRHMIRHVLSSYDRAHRTKAFARLELEDIDVPESRVDELLSRLGLPDIAREHVLGWFREHCRSADALGAAHRPFRGVLDVIRWLQMQPNTVVALNSGRPERERSDTLASLNELGALSRVHFTDELLMLDAEPHRKDTAAAKVEGLQRLRDQGYRIAAVIDDEVENLRVMRASGVQDDALFLHAQHLFARRDVTADNDLGGDEYDLLQLAERRPLPEQLHLVWRGLDDTQSRDAFMESPVRWGSTPVSQDARGRLVARQGSTPTTSRRAREGAPLAIETLVAQALEAGKSLRFELPKGGEIVDELLELLRQLDMPGDCVAFRARIEDLGPSGFRHLKWAYPESTLMAPLDFLGPLSRTIPERARELLDTFESWGLTRYELDWSSDHLRHLLLFLEADGREVDVNGVTDLESFFQAALLSPSSLTADFRFPQWLDGDTVRQAERRAQLERIVPAAASA